MVSNHIRGGSVSEARAENVQTWVDLLKQFDQAREHFAEAYRQTLLGSAETIRVLQQMTRDADDIGQTDGPVLGLLDLLRRGLLLWADRVPGLLEASNLDLARREALVTVQEVLLAEVERTREAPDSEQKTVKLEALEAILRVVEMELSAREETTEPAAPAEAANGAMRRVVIE